MVPQRRLFRVRAPKLASDESLGHQNIGAMYHRGRSQIASISESHGGDLIIQRYDWSGWRAGLLQCSHSLKGAWQVRGQGRGELLGGHIGVEAGGRKGRGSDDESSGTQPPKSKASVRKEVDSEEHHSAAEADLPIAKEGTQMRGNG
ncbi:hypothetical protein B296_00053727 [Ensete ventricosum]|uniref:Uncharacterized protein n=1 Tax=Ensete ventricosum TaxID=4639 RepID=A0A426X1T3_ENSVE|nr:hypothetical protein B296_00053727 [Ensete ventricosum]